MAIARPSIQELRESLTENGFASLLGVVDRARLAVLTASLRREFARVRASGELFAGGGTVSGHLNCFPGEESRFVHDELERGGIFDIARQMSTGPLRSPNIGCNLNLPGSNPQNEHADGYAADPFLIVNVAAVDTDLTNGAIEVLAQTHHTDHKYWEVMLGRPERRRLSMRAGDVLIRTSTLWHRGMPNPSPLPRPMLAFTWENGGSDLPDPYSVHGGKITFLPNRFHTDWKGRLRERAFVAAPSVGTAFRVVTSLLEK